MKKHNLHKIIAAFLLGSSLSFGTASFANQPVFNNVGEEELAPVMLKHDVTVAGDSILLGDIFENAGENAHRAVAPAPEVGKTKKLGASWLLRVAQFYKLEWQPLSSFDEVIVDRDSYEMDTGILTDALRDAIFQETGQDENLEIQLSGRLPEINLPLNADMSVALKHFRLSSDGTRFTASYQVPASGKVHASGKLNGKIHKLMEVAMPNRRINAGEIIRAQDLAYVSIRSNQVSRKAIIDPQALIGMQVRRTVTPGRPITGSNVQAPTLVQKKKFVLIELESLGMRLTAKGIALDNGSMKDIIRVKNSHSGQVVEAVVTGINRVSVRSPMQSAQM